VRTIVTTLLAVTLAATSARADELAGLLAAGPLVRIETDPTGKFKEGLAIAEVDAPVDLVWKVLTDFGGYTTWMPRVEKCEVTRDGADYLMEMKIDTPLVSTRYTNRVTVDDVAKTMRIRHEKGDLKGTHYLWRVVPIGDGKRTRLYYGGVIKNFSSVAEGMEDDQQTITIGINVASLLATIKSVKLQSERVARTPPSISAPAK
jgi:carbon monoxide dehydrogenase subunit G